MDPLDDLRQRLEDLRSRHLLRRRRVVEGPGGTQLRIGAEGGEAGREVLAFCSNDYLGLSTHPEVVEALARGARRCGAGAGASALISGHRAAHQRLEDRLAALQAPHLPDCQALLFSTGYLANVSTLAALAGRDTEVFSEELNHASLIDGIRLSGARCTVYPHRDTEALAGALERSRAPRRMIVTDAVFSMDGDLAPLPRLLELAHRHGAWLLVDDAHGLGVLGADGRGSLAHHGLRSERLVYVGTLGKALGVSGAFVAAHATVIEYLLQRARGYVYSTAPAPALAEALEVALELSLGAEGARLRSQLARLGERLRAALAGELGSWRLLASATPIVPVVIGESSPTLAVAAALFEQGLWVPAIRPPTVPEGTARLRITLSAAHGEGEVERLAAALRREARRHG